MRGSHLACYLSFRMFHCLLSHIMANGNILRFHSTDELWQSWTFIVSKLNKWWENLFDRRIFCPELTRLHKLMIGIRRCHDRSFPDLLIDRGVARISSSTPNNTYLRHSSKLWRGSSQSCTFGLAVWGYDVKKDYDIPRNR